MANISTSAQSYPAIYAIMEKTKKNGVLIIDRILLISTDYLEIKDFILQVTEEHVLNKNKRNSEPYNKTYDIIKQDENMTITTIGTIRLS